MIQAKELAPTHFHSIELMNELSDKLKIITGDTGTSSFDIESFIAEKGVFIVIYEEDAAVGCGSLRRHDVESCELKRMYSRKRGIGRMLMAELFEKARHLGYSRMVLSTRRVNIEAVNFYLRNGFDEISPYGHYCSKPESICMARYL
ncbi:hypothetical protein BTA51_13410 [Hahella sp. CCB-MM4]|uniref:GNAT family N-acetyltransferase n=1 Tax=Hahella sp. (strain CCB-MM4) TaxID=1926491 RepID=UPI000B9C755F|nr:GNAT family N-acetyltransferase [Hahella sp. CCB-MM4]OZG72952.1 hypothetical protein BTA51_13410 [Hahella sp. CCB-MM4]